MVETLNGFRPWFYAAAAYNVAWGTAAIVAPGLMLAELGVDVSPLVVWQLVGMFVLVFAPAYGGRRRPDRHPHLVAIALTGKVLGAAGFCVGLAAGALPLSFGLTVVTNDLVWILPFAGYLRASARARGGWRALLAG